MAWVSFAFPRCPTCSQSWETSRHRACALQGKVELDPDRRMSRCDSCKHTWSITETYFFCSCGNQFTSKDVEGALDEIVRAARLLARIVEQHKADIADIHRAGESSVRRWLSTVVEGIGGSLGKALGSLIGSIVKSIFGPIP